MMVRGSVEPGTRSGPRAELETEAPGGPGTRGGGQLLLLLLMGLLLFCRLPRHVSAWVDTCFIGGSFG